MVLREVILSFKARLLISFLLLTTANLIFAQGYYSSIGDRENIGIYGGPADDLSFSVNNRIFASVQSPFTLFYSDDTAKTWIPAFPRDSMEYDFGNRGWGGGSMRVISNQIGWINVITGTNQPQLSASVISYDNGNSFKTAFDPKIIFQLTGDQFDVNAVALSDHYSYAAMGPYIVRTNDTMTNGPGQILVDINTLPGIAPGSYVSWVDLSNDPSGLPFYFIVSKNNTNEKKLFKSYGLIFFELSGLPPNHQCINVFTHPAQNSGDTLFVSTRDTLTNEINVFRSYSGGFIWSNITPLFPLSSPLADCDYSADWIPGNPQGDGIILSFRGGLLSADLGSSWQGPANDLLNLGIAVHPENTNFILGSNKLGVAVSNNSIAGPFINETNIGFENIFVNDFSESAGVYCVATKSGLAYTTEYFNPTITGFNQWIPPNGFFPVPNVGDEISSVVISPFNADHIICGSPEGFYVTFNGPNDFTLITPPGWNLSQHSDPTVTDIVFINPLTIIATTGLKFNGSETIPYLPAGNIWRSMDGGTTWNIVTPFIPDEFTMGNCVSMGAGSGPTVLYAGTGYDSPGLQVDGELWNSLDFGDTWQKVNDGPVINGNPASPIFDIDIDLSNNQILYLSASNGLARSTDGGSTYFITDVPSNEGRITSALIDPLNPDSVAFTMGRQLFKYSYQIDDADRKFRGLPGEMFSCSSFGSILGGSNTGAYKFTEAPTHYLELIILLEGPYNGADMNTDLNTNGLLPLTQPFNQAPWFYEGTEHASAIPNPDVVDWVLIDLRKTQGDPSTATKETRFNRQAAFLLKDGTIVDDDGITSPRFSIILENNKGSDKVQGVVYSPGHIGERSADSLLKAKSNTFSYDFTSGAEQVYGGKLAHKELSPGIWGMISGDGNHDFQVDNADKNDIWFPQNGNTGYYFGDFNRDGTVDLTDLNDFWKPNAGRGIQID